MLAYAGFAIAIIYYAVFIIIELILVSVSLLILVISVSIGISKNLKQASAYKIVSTFYSFYKQLLD